MATQKTGTTPLDRKTIERMPKVLLHEHLDGGLRPETILELAKAKDYELPESEPEALSRW
ncbi:MAG: adenosine deaminase, partial [Planctomycetota bacterium]